MKKLLTVILVLITALLCFAACTDGTNDGNGNSGNHASLGGISGGNTGSNGSGNGTESDNDGKNESGSQTGNDKTDDNEEQPTPPVSTASNILIAYFSCTNTTEKIATHIEAETKGTLYEIIPQVPYTADDLKYYTNCRADKEQADSKARPAISGSVENIEHYDVVFIGYPIWHGQAPKIIYTFLESYDFSGKTVVPFCTSASSGIGSSDTNLHALAPDANWLSGKRFASGTSQKTVADWIDGLDLKSKPETEEITKMYLTINGNKLEVALAENSSVDALVEILKQGDITFTAEENGNFEMYGDIGHSLTTNDKSISAQAGDIILYAGRYLCLFFGSNTYSYTQIGKINGYSASRLRTLLGADRGSIQVTVSLS